MQSFMRYITKNINFKHSDGNILHLGLQGFWKFATFKSSKHNTIRWKGDWFHPHVQVSTCSGRSLIC